MSSSIPKVPAAHMEAAAKLLELLSKDKAEYPPGSAPTVAFTLAPTVRGQEPVLMTLETPKPVSEASAREQMSAHRASAPGLQSERPLVASRGIDAEQAQNLRLIGWVPVGSSDDARADATSASAGAHKGGDSHVEADAVTVADTSQPKPKAINTYTNRDPEERQSRLQRAMSAIPGPRESLRNLANFVEERRARTVENTARWALIAAPVSAFLGGITGGIGGLVGNAGKSILKLPFGQISYNSIPKTVDEYGYSHIDVDAFIENAAVASFSLDAIKAVGVGNLAVCAPLALAALAVGLVITNKKPRGERAGAAATTAAVTLGLGFALPAFIAASTTLGVLEMPHKFDSLPWVSEPYTNYGQFGTNKSGFNSTNSTFFDIPPLLDKLGHTTAAGATQLAMLLGVSATAIAVHVRNNSIHQKYDSTAAYVKQSAAATVRKIGDMMARCAPAGTASTSSAVSSKSADRAEAAVV
jgi:hypothetical protein